MKSHNEKQGSNKIWENQEKVNLIFPWRLMEMDCLAYRQEIDTICEKEGIQQMNELVHRLLADGRQEDLLQATADAEFRQKLLAEYKIR